MGVWEKHKKVLYCTRHTFINKLYSEKVDENVIKTLVGHGKAFTMKYYGFDPNTTTRLLEEISKVNYSRINWKELKIYSGETKNFHKNINCCCSRDSNIYRLENNDEPKQSRYKS